MVLRVVGVTVAITLFFFSFSEPSFSITKEAATAQWNAVKGTKEESTFLINFILNVNMPGFFPDTLKERFYEIATPEDAKHLLDNLVNPRFRQKTTALTLLEGLRGDEFTKLFEEYLYLVSDERVQNRLYHIMLYQNSSSAFQAAVKFLNFLQETGKEKESFFYISGLSFFKNPDILQEIIAGVSSDSSITRAASYTALRNYPDDEVLSIIKYALSTDTAIIPGEKTSPHYSRRHTTSGNKQRSLIVHLLNIAKKEINRTKRKKVDAPPQKLDSGYNEAIEGSIALSSLPDQTLGEMYAPYLYLSTSDASYAVDLYNEDEGYLYTDYVPMYVNNVTRLDRQTANLHLAEPVTYEGTNYDAGDDMPLGTLNYIGDPLLRLEDNYLDFSPVWDGWFVSLEEGYRMLTIYPSVYFKVFRDPDKTYPTAIQYWFFSFYNEWFKSHPGDWETITIFLDENDAPAEAIFSTHYEANKYKWVNVQKINTTHPKVFVSNGGHGSYRAAGQTLYSSFYDYHRGDKEELIFTTSAESNTYGHYYLLDLTVEENKTSNDSWIFFEGRWGNGSSAPGGPHFRTDASNILNWDLAKYPPYDPSEHCAERTWGANIYGNQTDVGDKKYGPWYWASGYGLDQPWESQYACRRSNNQATNTPMLYLMLLKAALDF